MSADDAVCKPLLYLYNKMLSEAIAALRSHPSTAPFTSDFEVLQPESFKAIDFRLPPIEMGGADVGIYRADVFNDGVTKGLFDENGYIIQQRANHG